MTSTRTRAFANRLTRGMLAAAAASVLLAGPAAAQNSGNVSMSAGADIVNQYYFRGIIQETGGFIMQPFLDASISFGNASITAGTWSSLHSRGDAGFDGAPEAFYETDFYAGIGGAAGPVGIDVTYTAYMSPRGSWGTTKEVALGLSFDSVAAPYATFAFETAGGAEGGPNKGTYFELGVEPSAPLDGPVGLSFPVALGMSLNNYFEYMDASGSLTDAKFGFFSVGASIGYEFDTPEEYGTWGLGLGISALVFGEGLKAINGEDSGVKPIALFGLSVGY
ncbi:MAG: hypothetical protein OXG35_11515 [Acidobacteria bacterium]|nr:hypothetical protein [Acidobacteriota bacterium]